MNDERDPRAQENDEAEGTGLFPDEELPDDDDDDGEGDDDEENDPDDEDLDEDDDSGSMEPPTRTYTNSDY